MGQRRASDRACGRRFSSATTSTRFVQDVRSRIAPEREAEGETFDTQPAYSTR